MGRTVPYDPTLYGKKPPATTRAPAKPPPDPFAQINSFIKQMYGYIETPAQQEARVRREIDAQIAAQKKVLDDEYARQMAQARANAAGMEAAGSAAAAMSKDLFGAVGGEFNSAAGEIKGLSHGLTGDVGGMVKGDIAAGNKALGAMAGGGGNVAVQAGAGGGPLAPGGSLQVGVEDYRDGTLGSQLLSSLGEAAQFGLAGQTAAQNMKATEEAKAALVSASKDINDNQQKAIDSLNAGRLDLFHTYMNDANSSRVQYLSLLQGLLTSKAATAATAATTKPYTQKDAQGRIWQYDYTTGKWKLQIGTKKVGIEKPLQHVTIGGKAWTFNPNTGTYTDPATGKAGSPITPPKPGKPTYWTDSTTGDRHMTTQGPNGVTDTIIRKGTKPAPGAKGALTTLQLNRIVSDWYTGKTGLVPVVDPKGKQLYDPKTGVPIFKSAPGQQKVDYQQALKKLLALKVPPQQALAVLDASFKRGERGRPALSVMERAALTQAKLQPAAHHFNAGEWDRIRMHARTLFPAGTAITRAFLSQAQVAALQKAGFPLPAGKWLPAGVRGTAFSNNQLSQQPVYVIYQAF